jgi:predicted nucleotidyltransferase
MPDALETVAAAEAERAANYDTDELDLLLDALDDTLAALADAGVDHLFIGGLSSSLLGRPRVTHDIDVLLRPHDARPALEALGRHGFATEERAPHWLFKAHRGDQEVDLIFRSSGNVYLDDEMLERSVELAFEGRVLRVLGAEDMIVMKALAHEEHSPRHWHDALALVSRPDLDWDYLVRRALRHGARRVASLLLYAQSNDLHVPAGTVAALLPDLVPAPPVAEGRP